MIFTYSEICSLLSDCSEATASCKTNDSTVTLFDRPSSRTLLHG